MRMTSLWTALALSFFVTVPAWAQGQQPAHTADATQPADVTQSAVAVVPAAVDGAANVARPDNVAEPAEATEATDAPEPAAIAPALWLDGDYRPVAREDAEFGGELEANEDDAWTLHVLDLDNGRRRASLTLDGPDPATASHAGRFQTYHDNGQPRTVGEYDDQRHFTGVLKGFNDEGVQLSRIEVRGNDRHGKDIRYHDDGKTVRSETDFVDGKQHGTHRAYFPGGEGALRTQAHFREGKRHGVLRHYYPNGQLRSELTYEDGTVEGASRRWAQDGTLTRDETLRNGKPIGESRHFHNDGTPRRVVIYDDEGARQKDTRFYPDGQVQRVWSQETFEGKPVQAERRFARDGQILSETLRSEDRRHRWVKGWGADGTLRQDIYYLDGSPDGLARRMTGRNGYSLTEYADGKRHGKFESHRDGKLFERGEYHEGQRTGRWERYEDDTVRVSEYNREGRSHGEVSLTVAGELRRFETYRHGVRHGRYEMRNSDGVVRERGNYVDGERDGPWIVALQDLRLESEAMVSMAQGEYRLGKRVGTWEARLGPGYLIERVTFNDEGERHGPMYRFAEDGRLLMHATFVNGMANGRYIQNEPDGTPRTDGIVKDDRLVEDYLEDDVSAGASG